MELLKEKLVLLSVFNTPLIKAAVSPFIDILSTSEGVPTGTNLKAAESISLIYSRLIKDGEVQTLGEYLFSVLKEDENPLSLCYLKGLSPSKELIDRSKQEYEFLDELAGYDFSPASSEFSIPKQSSLPRLKPQKLPPFKNLVQSYIKNGCGVYGKAKAYSWNERNKTLEPLYSPSPVRLTDLKNYDDEKTAVIKNTEAFIKGLPATNVLLYGDRGTGKSSTVQALINEYYGTDLRLIELGKNAVSDLKQVLTAVARIKFKFIIFIDDLSFTENGGDDFAALKAALEGGLLKTKNTLVYATSNRRHLIKESLADRAGTDVHLSDTIEEQLSLSDRFGIIVTYLNPSKSEFIDILKQLLSDRKIEADEKELETKAERYAIKKGGRSPRAAKQLADFIESGLI